MRCLHTVGLLLAHRLRRWANIKTNSGQTSYVCLGEC